jgi:hypothetical protein
LASSDSDRGAPRDSHSHGLEAGGELVGVGIQRLLEDEPVVAVATRAALRSRELVPLAVNSRWRTDR